MAHAQDIESAAGRALQTIAAQRQADALVDQVCRGELDAEGLAERLAPLYGAALIATARSIVRALQAQPVA